MTAPIADFLREYDERGGIRFHMPGHKGRLLLGCENLDITEIQGADALYEAQGIIAQSEKITAALFGTRRTCYSTEGSSQCIRAMLYLALTNRAEGASATVVAARNVHKAFVYAAALLDLDVVWLWPEDSFSLCSCHITAENLDSTLSGLDAPPAAVYVTSPDYLGGMADISALAQVCHRHGTILAVDNAHGAYLRFLSPSLHPMDLGADICCDSAHKTLPVLTGGAYLHISKNAPAAFAENAKQALALFGSTSPSYLTLASLDLCAGVLADDFPARLAEAVSCTERVKAALRENGWQVLDSDPTRITLRAPGGLSGTELAAHLRLRGIECEYADGDHLVLMLSPENDSAQLDHLVRALGKNTHPGAEAPLLPLARGERAMSIRQALFSPHETMSAAAALGRVCGAPTVSCPPAVPIAVSGERIGPEAVKLFELYGVETVDVLK